MCFHCSLSVSVCVSFCQWTKFQLNQCTNFDAVFAKLLLTALARTLLKLVTLGQRSRSQLRNIPFFLHNSLLTFLVWISALLWKMKFKMSLRYALGRFVCKFHKNQLGDDVIESFSIQMSIIQILFNLQFFFLWYKLLTIWNTSNNSSASDLDRR